MKKEPASLSSDNLSEWINYLVQCDQDNTKKIEKLSNEVEEINKKLHILGRSVLKLYKHG